MKTDILSVLREQIFDTSAPLWWPGITEFLVNQRLKRPVSRVFPSCLEYTTSGFLNAGIPSLVRWVESGPNFKSPRIRLECLSDQATNHDLLKNHVLAGVPEISSPETTKTIGDALSLIASEPTLLRSVGKLVRSVHLLHQPDRAFDVSFSDPYIPFSIFISVPNGSSNAAPRVAEAIIHESMHLQLSLIEHSIPLARTNSARHHSPWKHHDRPVSGIIHALYVFAVIDEWIKSLGDLISHADYFEQRQKEIASEILNVDFHNCLVDATDEGRKLITLIMNRFPYR